MAVNIEQNAPATLAEQYKALRKEYDIAAGSGVLLTDAERLKFAGRVYKHHYAVAAKFGSASLLWGSKDSLVAIIS